MVTLTQLEYLVAVAKFGHFGRAAQACHVTQPSLSMQIQKLEEALSITVFDRSKKPILATTAGTQILEQAQRILEEAKKLEAIAARSSGEIAGSFTLAIIPTLGPYLLPRFLHSFAHSYPRLELKIREMQTERIIDALDRDEIDAGLLATPLDQPRLVEHALFYEPFSLYASKNHPLAQHKKLRVEDLKHTHHRDLWLLEEGHCLRGQIAEVCSIAKKSRGLENVEFQSGSLETLKKLVQTAGGYTLVPALALPENGHTRHAEIRDFIAPIPSREIGLVYRRRHYKLPVIDALAESILSNLPQHLLHLRKQNLSVLPV